jgi:transposase
VRTHLNAEQLILFLGLSDIEIERVEMDNDKTLYIYVKSLKDQGQCHRCGKSIDHYHGLGQEIKLRHLPIFGYKTYIVIRPRRLQCQTCDDKPTTTQQMDWHTPKSAFTKAYEKNVMLSLINSTIQDVSIVSVQPPPERGHLALNL